MTVWSTLEASCPMCQHRLRVREVGGGVATGQDSDLLVRMRGHHVIQAEIHTCKACRFSGYAYDFTTRSVTSAMVKSFFESCAGLLRETDAEADQPVTAPLSRPPLPHLQYYWAAIASSALGLSVTEGGLRMARAYWCLRLSPSSKLDGRILKRLRKLYLREAISRMRKGLRAEKNRVIVYLVGELCRRNGNFLLAQQYFRRFLEREEGPRYLKQATAKLYEAAKAGDQRPKGMEELLFDAPPKRRRA